MNGITIKIIGLAYLTLILTAVFFLIFHYGYVPTSTFRHIQLGTIMASTFMMILVGGVLMTDQMAYSAKKITNKLKK
jgi:hypothetical protein